MIIKCEKCKYFKRNKIYKYEGVCLKDDNYTREFRVCHKLEKDSD